MIQFLYKLSIPEGMAAAVVAGSVASWVLCWPVRRLGIAMKIMDKPTERSSHTTPTPRTGGIAVVLGALVAMVLVGQLNRPLIVAGAIGSAVTIISLIDDVYSMSSLPRLLVHVLVATATVLLINLAPQHLGLPYADLHLPHWLGLALAVLFTVGFVNFFNFMDGINGLAASQGMFGAMTIGVILCMGGAENSALTSAALAGACLGYLPHNFPKAKIFMGDVGSTTIGFALAMLTLVGGARTKLDWVPYIMPLGVFIYDAGFTVIKRAVAGEKITAPHRKHHYELLTRCGWSHTAVTGLQMVLMALWCVGAIVYARFNPDTCEYGNTVRLAVLASLLAIMIVYSIAVHAYFRKHGDKPVERAA